MGYQYARMGREIGRALARWFLVAAALAAPGWAEARPKSGLAGLEVVVTAHGADAPARESLLRGLRRELADVLGPLSPSRELDRALVELGISQGAARVPANLARAGRRVGAQYVVAVDVSKQGRELEARGRLIETEGGKVELELPIPLDPRGDATELGVTLARRVLARLETLRSPEGDLIYGGRPKEPDPSLPGATAKKPPPAPPAPAPTAAPAPPPAAAEVEAPPPIVRTDVLRVALGGGAGLLRNYSLGGGEVARSAVSHGLGPVSLFAGEIELYLPNAHLGLLVRGAYRTVQYEVAAGSEGRSTPDGSLFDLDAAVGYHLPLQDGGGPVLVPSLGLRLNFADVAPHMGSIVLTSNTAALVAGAAIRWPVDERLELSAGLAGGMIFLYRETPRESGQSAGGYTFGGDLGARFWVFEAVALAADVRFTLDGVSFADQPSRILPPVEQGRLADASLSISDLRVSFGVAFRL